MLSDLAVAAPRKSLHAPPAQGQLEQPQGERDNPSFVTEDLNGKPMNGLRVGGMRERRRAVLHASQLRFGKRQRSSTKTSDQVHGLDVYLRDASVAMEDRRWASGQMEEWTGSAEEVSKGRQCWL